MKKKLSKAQEFEVMKLVLDKYLWLGFLVMAFGMYKMMEVNIMSGIYYLIAGSIVLILFMVFIVKEYEIIS